MGLFFNIMVKVSLVVYLISRDEVFVVFAILFQTYQNEYLIKELKK